MTPFDVYVYASGSQPDPRLGGVTCLGYHVQSKTPVAEFCDVALAENFAAAVNQHAGLLEQINQLNWKLRNQEYRASNLAQKPTPRAGSWLNSAMSSAWQPDTQVQPFVTTNETSSTAASSSSNVETNGTGNPSASVQPATAPQAPDDLSSSDTPSD